MLPSGMTSKDYKDYCRLSQGSSTASTPFEAEDVALQKSPYHSKGVILRHKLLSSQENPSQELEVHLGPDLPPILIATTLNQRCIVMNPLRHNMILMLEAIRAIERLFDEYSVANEENLKADGVRKYKQLIYSLREFCLLTWNFFETELLDGKLPGREETILNISAQISGIDKMIEKQKTFFQLIGALPSTVLFSELLRAFGEALKSDAIAKKNLCVFACPLDGTLDKKFGSSSVFIDPLPNFRLDSFKWLESTLEYVASCGERSRDLFSYLFRTASLALELVEDPEDRITTENFIHELELLDEDVDTVTSSIRHHLSRGTFMVSTVKSLDFYSDGILEIKSLRQAVLDLEPFELIIDEISLRFDVYQKAYQTFKSMAYDKKVDEQFITDIKIPFSLLAKLTQNLVVDHSKYLKKALHSADQLFASNPSKSAYIRLLDLWTAKILEEPSLKKVDFIIKLYDYLDQSDKPRFESSIYQGLQQALKKLDDEIDFLHKTPFCRKIDLNLNSRFFHATQGSVFGLDSEAVIFIKKNIKNILNPPIAASFSIKIGIDLKSLLETKTLEDFIEQGKALLKKHHLALCSRNNIVAIILEPFSRYVSFDEESARSTPSPSLSGKKKKKSQSSPCSSPCPPKPSRSSSQQSHRALFIEDFSPIEAETLDFESRSTPITSSLIHVFLTLRLDPTILYAMAALKKDSKLYQSPILFYDESLNLFHNLLEKLLDPHGVQKHDLLSIVHPSLSLDPQEMELLTILDKDRKYRLTADPILESCYPHHNPRNLDPNIEEKFLKDQKIFFSLVAKCLKAIYSKDLDQSGLTFLSSPIKTTFHPRVNFPQFDSFNNLVNRLTQKSIAKIPLEKRQDYLIRTERFRQQTNKIQKSMRALGEALQILHPDNTEMVDFSIVHQTLYHLSILTESVLLQLLLTKSTLNRVEPNRHIAFELEEMRPLYNDHNTQRVLQALSIDMQRPLSPAAKAQIETFRNFSNIVFRYLSEADGRCHVEYLSLLRILNLITKDLDEVHSGFTTPDMVHLLGTDHIDSSQEKIHQIQREGYIQIIDTVKRTLDALKELLIAHQIDE